MRIAERIVSVLSKIPKSGPRCLCHSNSRNSHIFVRMKPWKKSSPIQGGSGWRILVPVEAKIRNISLTDPRRAWPPYLILLLRPVVRIVTILTSRRVRKWWKKLPPEEKKKVLRKIRERYKSIAAVGMFAFIVLALYYYGHMYETPFTKRKRFLMFSDKSLNLIGEMEWYNQISRFKSHFVPKWHPFYLRSSRVANKIIYSNKDIPEIRDKNWSMVVVDKPDIINAFCLPTGHIIVYTGILNLCTNDDQLAIVLSHEISHVVLSHAAENLSTLYRIDAMLLIPSFICWLLFADMAAIMTEGLTKFLSSIFIRLPYNRILEMEADEVGLYLASRACYDVREATILWDKFAAVTASIPGVEWLSTHPSSETRKENLKKLLPVALQVRSDSKCPKLKPRLVSFFPW